MKGKARCRRWVGLALLAVTAALVGCRTPGTPTSGPPAAPPPSGSQGPDLITQNPADLSRDEIRAGLLRLLGESGQDPEAALEKLTERWGLRGRDGSLVPYLKADLDGNGLDEYVLALGVTDPGALYPGKGAALFVIYRQGDRLEVDRSDPMSEGAELNLMEPYLHGVADLTNSGRLQIVWSRPHVVATGPQPHSVFVTEWTPGSFRHLPGEMAISRWRDGVKVALEGRDLVLTGGSRSLTETGTRVDRYRYQEGAFRLVDRRFVHDNSDPFLHLETEEPAYGLFWDGVVAEAVGRVADAEAFYRAALDPARRAHPGTLWQYNALPKELDEAELAAFDEALRALVRFRLGGVLLRTGRAEEAAAILQHGHGRYQGLLDALRTAPSPAEGCQAAAEWAAAHPDFLTALNLGGIPWEPRELCAHPPLEDSLAPVEDSPAPLGDSPAG
ncbi:MAG: hypothetical protein L6E13_13065 [Firmicutes bacterium]|nr:hypothetical protein [Bacillota bacterium]